MNKTSVDGEKIKAAKVKVLLVDDHPIILFGFAMLINREQDLTVVGEAANGSDALNIFDRTFPDVVVTDLRMPGMNGLELIKRVKEKSPKIGLVVLSMQREELFAERAFAAGAHGYLCKSDSHSKVLDAIRMASVGRLYVTEKITELLVTSALKGKSSVNSLRQLSNREMEVLQLLGKGMPARIIASGLGLSVKTVESHFAHLKRKLKLRDASELLQFAVQNENEEFHFSTPVHSAPPHRSHTGMM